MVLNFDKERLDSAQAFDKSQLSNRTWLEDNYKHFGQAPYWTEGERSSEGMQDFPSGTTRPEYTWP